MSTGYPAHRRREFCQGPEGIPAAARRRELFIKGKSAAMKRMPRTPGFFGGEVGRKALRGFDMAFWMPPLPRQTRGRASAAETASISPATRCGQGRAMGKAREKAHLTRKNENVYIPG